MPMNKSLLAHTLAIITVCVWGVTFVNTRYAVDSGMHPTELFVMRFAIAYLCIWCFTLFAKKRRSLWADSLKDELIFISLGTTGGSAYFTAENFAVKYTLVDNVSFIVCTAPLITIIIARLVTKSVRFSSRLMAGSVIALVGVAVVIFNGHFVLQLNPKGDFLALLAAFFWAVYSLVIKKVSGGRYDAVFITRKVFAYGIITALPIFFFDPWHVTPEMLSKPALFGNIIYLGLVASFTCFVTWSWVIKTIGALKTSNYVYLNPCTTVIASAIALNEPLTALAIVGSILILAGVFLVNTTKLS